MLSRRQRRSEDPVDTKEHLPSADFTSHDHAELVARVDPFGRAERGVASDDGVTLSAFRGTAESLALVLDSAGVPLARTVSHSDPRGNVLQVWEDKAAPGSAADPPAFPTDSQLEIGVPSPTRVRFVNTSHAYDVASRLTEVTVSGRSSAGAVVDQTRSFVYNDVGDLESATLPEMGSGNGTVTYSKLDARGKPRSTVYPGSGGRLDSYDDAAGRFIERWACPGTCQVPDVNWYKAGYASYGQSAASNNIGKPITQTRYNLVLPPTMLDDGCSGGCVDSSSISVTHTYTYGDAQGLLSQRSTTVGFGGEPATGGSQRFDVTYSYDLWGNVDQLTYPTLYNLTLCAGAPTVDHTWDVVSLQGAQEVGLSALLTIPADGYDQATGMLTSWQTPSGTFLGRLLSSVQHTVTVDDTRSRPKRISATGSGHTFFDSGDYTYNALGNVTQIGSPAIWAYSYDDLGRLTGVTTSPHDTKSFTYDDLGNLLNAGSGAVAIDAATNRISATGFRYDQRGNLVAEPQPSPTWWTRGLGFDLENHLVSAWADVDAMAFAYDLAGERVLQYRVRGSVTDATFSIRDEAGNVLTDFSWSPSDGAWTRLAEHFYIGRVPAVHMTTSGIYRHYTTVVADHLQSTRAEVVNATTGQSVARDYWPFGATAYQSGIPVGKHLFTSQEREHTGTAQGVMQGLDNFHRRELSTWRGRFTSLDPAPGGSAGSQSWNRYSYVLNDPLRFIDPFGERWFQTTNPETGEQEWVYLEGVDELTLSTKAGDVTIPGVEEFVTFNGTSLTLYQSKGTTASFEARAGQLDAQGNTQPSLQGLEDVGPIPEGTWSFNPNETQRYTDLSSYQKVKSEFGGSAWPGSTESWGVERVWLNPVTYKGPRNKFTIHGGSAYGSRGCIDLSYNAPGFFGAMNRSLNYIPVVVSYP